MSNYNYAEMNASVPTLPLQLFNPNVGSSNKVGVQVNNYLVSDQAEVAEPFTLDANPSLRPENNGDEVFKITLDFSDSRKRSYELTTKTNLPTINRDVNTELLPKRADRNSKGVFVSAFRPIFTRLVNALSRKGTVSKDDNSTNVSKRVFGDGYQIRTTAGINKESSDLTSKLEEIGSDGITRRQRIRNRFNNFDDKQHIAFHALLRYFQIIPYKFISNSKNFARDERAEFFTELFQRGFLKFSSDGKESQQPDVDLEQLVATPRDFPFENKHSAQLVGKNVHNTLHQSFMVFDYSKGTQKLESTDTIVSATLRLKVKSHFGERSIPSHLFASQLTSLFGDLKCEPRIFQVARVKKEIATFNASSDKTGSDKQNRNPLAPNTLRFDPSNTFSKWETPYGVGSKDVDITKASEFTISEPMKEGQFIDIDITDLLKDAIENRSQVLRLVIRPKSEYPDTGLFHIGNDGYVAEGGFGQGNHWFEFFDEPGDRPQVIVKATLSPTSSRSRINSFKKTRPGSSITK
jgi:hypothetical protein